MNRTFTAAKGDIGAIEKALGFRTGHSAKGGGLYRIDVNDPLLWNARLPSGLERGANPLFRWGGYTSGGAPEAVIDPAPMANTTITSLGVER